MKKQLFIYISNINPTLIILISSIMLSLVLQSSMFLIVKLGKLCLDHYFVFIMWGQQPLLGCPSHHKVNMIEDLWQGKGFLVHGSDEGKERFI